jgi:hypothetical protein
LKLFSSLDRSRLTVTWMAWAIFVETGIVASVFHQYEKLSLSPRVIRNDDRSTAKSARRYGGRQLQLE